MTGAGTVHDNLHLLVVRCFFSAKQLPVATYNGDRYYFMEVLLYFVNAIIFNVYLSLICIYLWHIVYIA